MILRRLTKHVKDTNWFAVALDFVIVVFGVFIGLQVNNWNTARADIADAHVVLKRLEQDFVNILTNTDSGIASRTESLRAAGRLVTGIRDKKFNEDTLLIDMTAATAYGKPSGASSTFTELVSTGRLKLIQNQALRTSLAEYHSFVSFLNSQYDDFLAPLALTRQTLMHASTLHISGIPQTEFSQIFRRDAADQDMLFNDPNMMTVLQIAYSTQDNIHAILYINKTNVLDILQQIRAEQENIQ
jgi:hypothetical protein